MNAFDRRRLLQSLSGMALASVSAGRSLATTVELRFEPPAGKLALSRRLVRILGDGAQIVVRRTWNIQIFPTATGYRVDGRQSAVEVDAPSELAALASAERQREELGLFPILLDRNGLMTEQSKFVDSAAVDQALARVSSEISQDNLPARALLERLHSGADAIVSQLPRDFLAPRSGGWTKQWSVPLPSGAKGQVSVRYLATRSSSGLLDRAERTVTTMADGSTRVSTETWTLKAL